MFQLRTKWNRNRPRNISVIVTCLLAVAIGVEGVSTAAFTPRTCKANPPSRQVEPLVRTESLRISVVDVRNNQPVSDAIVVVSMRGKEVGIREHAKADEDGTYVLKYPFFFSQETTPRMRILGQAYSLVDE